MLIVALVAVAAGSTISYVHFPWLLLVLVGLFLWHRTAGTTTPVTPNPKSTGSIGGLVRPAAGVGRHPHAASPDRQCRGIPAKDGAR